MDEKSPSEYSINIGSSSLPRYVAFREPIMVKGGGGGGEQVLYHVINQSDFAASITLAYTEHRNLFSLHFLQDINEYSGASMMCERARRRVYINTMPGAAHISFC